MALAAPPPPPESEVAAEINQQSQEADRAEADAGVAPEAPPVNIEAGQTLAQVEAALGQPQKHLTVGQKTIYVYKDMKITFKEGKVTDVQ